MALINRLDSCPWGLDTHWAVHGVGDFRGPLPPKLQKLVDEIERIYLYNAGHYGRDSANHPKILIYTKWAAMVPTILARIYLYNVEHYGRDSANHLKILIYAKWAALVPTIWLGRESLRHR
jgi:hypothetical protein